MAQQSTASRLAAIPAGIAGYLFASYAGAALWIPAIAGVLVLIVAIKTAKPAARPFAPAIGVHGAQLIWMTVGCIALGRLDANVIDLVVLAAGILGLFLIPGGIPAVPLLLFQVFGLVVNGVAASHYEAGTSESKGLLVHLLLRVLAITFLVTGWIGTRRLATQASNGPPPTNVV